MPFDRRDIRPGMDVYTHDNRYLGNVLAIIPGLARLASGQPAAEGAQMRGHPALGSTLSGELLGPMPTQPLGNHASIVQSANNHYAATTDNAASLGEGSIIVGKWYGLLGKRTLSLDAVQTVSLERVVLRRF